jgi:hypothetical protein
LSGEEGVGLWVDVDEYRARGRRELGKVLVRLWGARGFDAVGFWVVGWLVWLVEKRESWRRWRGCGLAGVRLVGGELGIVAFFGWVGGSCVEVAGLME